MLDNTVSGAGADVDAAVSFFRDCMLTPYRLKSAPYRACGISESETTSQADWIVFAALLTGDRRGSESDLSELTRHHVRSHRLGSGPTYTMVQEAVDVEFGALATRSHLVFSYADNLSRVELRRFTGAQWAQYVEELGGISFFALSRFTDPEVTISPVWLHKSSELMLILDAGEVTYLNPLLSEQ